MTDAGMQREGRVAVIADTTCSLPEDVVQALGIYIVPYYVNMNKRTLRDVFDVRRDDFYRWMSTATELPTTSNPGAGDYLTVFREAYQHTREMVAICMTSIGSGAYQAAVLAKELASSEMPDAKIMVVDTRQVAMAHGFAVIDAARAAQAGASMLRVGTTARDTAFDAQLLQTADTLKYLYMGGRIGRAMHLFGSVLHIKPIISMQDGEIVALGQTRSRPRAYDKMVEIIGRRVAPGGRIRVAYLHAAAPEEIAQLRERVERAYQVVETFVCELSPALGVHTGPGTAGLVWVPAK